MKLYNYVIRPLRQLTYPKRSHSGKGAGTGGLKLKSMDGGGRGEDEERIAHFEMGGVPPVILQGNDSEHSDNPANPDPKPSKYYVPLTQLKFRTGP
jgi:hypothetical protein